MVMQNKGFKVQFFDRGVVVEDIYNKFLLYEPQITTRDIDCKNEQYYDSINTPLEYRELSFRNQRPRTAWEEQREGRIVLKRFYNRNKKYKDDTDDFGIVEIHYGIYEKHEYFTDIATIDGLFRTINEAANNADEAGKDNRQSEKQKGQD